MTTVYFHGGSMDGKALEVPKVLEIYRIPVPPPPEFRFGVSPGPITIEDYRLIDGVYVYDSQVRRSW